MIVKLKTFRFKNDSLSNWVYKGSNKEVLFMNPDGLPDAPYKVLKSINYVKKKLVLDMNIRAHIATESYSSRFNALITKNHQVYFILITSPLINLLDDNEMNFVIGHEIGHAIFNHLDYTKTADTTLDNIKSQCAEISADRIGFASVDDINIAASALHKLKYGIRYSQNKIDIKKLTDHINDPESGYSTTHPIDSLRLESIIRFSMSKKYREYTGDPRYIFEDDGLENYIYENIKKQIY